MNYVNIIRVQCCINRFLQLTILTLLSKCYVRAFCQCFPVESVYNVEVGHYLLTTNVDLLKLLSEQY